MAKNSTILGAAGAHYVMCQLLRREMIAALAPEGVPDVDIVVTDRIGDRLCSIQVKARTEIGADGGWHMKAKHEEIRSPTLFYCFVDFRKSLTDQPGCWVIPSEVVSHIIRASHRAWLGLPGKYGQPHNDSEMRRLRPNYANVGLGDAYGPNWMDQYHEAWELLRDVAHR